MDITKIKEKLIALKDQDLSLRNRLMRAGKLNEGYNEEMERVHIKNAEALDEIINHIGYPTIERVGSEANEAAWIIIQHAISKPEFMKKCQKLLSLTVAENNTDPKQLAYLTDRILVFQDKEQLYGTQFDWDENEELSPKPYDDIKIVNARRSSIGLNSLEEQTELMRQQAKEENHRPPKDWQSKKLAYNKWRQKVGWL